MGSSADLWYENIFCRLKHKGKVLKMTKIELIKNLIHVHQNKIDQIILKKEEIFTV